jgi:PAS domain S-box-containing protein
VDASAYRTLVENAPDAVVVSREGIILFANRAAATLLGHDDVSELVGKPMTFLDASAREAMRQRIQHMIVTGERLVPREYPARRRDGTEITAEIASTIVNFDGAPAVLAYARDVTDRARLRARLAHADRLASLGRMAAGIAHEINNPLTFMMLATEVLEGRVDLTGKALVRELRDGIDRIAGIVSDLRSFVRDEDATAGSVDLAAAIDAAERLVHHELRPRGVLLKEYSELPRVVGVQRRIEQVFVNLFLNAAHALGERADGRIVVRARTTPECVFVSVEDDGEGIPQEILASIFEPFFTTRSGSGGSGLGLSISRDIVTRAGGDLVATKMVGGGTAMLVTLVRATVDPPGPRPPRISARVHEGQAPRRVLVVDDEAAIVRLLSESLGSFATVVTETTPARALDLVLAGPGFDAIVCDVMMPGMSGVDLHERVARESPDVAARFVFITGGTYTARAREYLDRIANPRLQKPFGAMQLVEAIERVTEAEPRS